MTDCAALLDALLADPSRATRVPHDEAVALPVELARVARALENAKDVGRQALEELRRQGLFPWPGAGA